MSKIVPCRDLPDFMDEVKSLYSQGELFVYPTETLYGLGTDPTDESALKRLLTVKKRPSDMPVSVAVLDVDMMKEFGEVNEIAEKIACSFLPGPVTLIIKSKSSVSNYLKSNDKVGIRIPEHKIALGIIEKVGPITATSANLHNRADPRDVKEAYDQLGDSVKLYIDCKTAKYNVPSTVVDCTGASINIIRKGVIPEMELMALFEY